MKLSAPLASALSSFVTYGYHGTTVRRIARGAGLSVPGLYHHHPTKQDLLVRLLTMSTKEVLERSRTALATASDNPRDRLVALVENIVLYMTNRTDLAHLAHEIRSLEPRFREDYIQLRDEHEGLFVAEVKAAQEAGLFETIDAKEVARAVLVLCRGVADWYSPAGLHSPEDIAQRYIHFSLALAGDRAKAVRPSKKRKL